MALALLALFVVFRPVDALRPRASLLSVCQSDWDSFNASVSGRLYDGVPMLAPCYTTYNGEEQVPDDEECDNLQLNRGDPVFVSNHFGGYQASNWGGCQATGESCALGLVQPDTVTPATRACSQGSVPWKYVDAQSVEDVQKALVFAKERNLRLVVKNTGHDYLGRSSAPDSFAIWTHHIQSPIELTKGFIPDGCLEEAGDVITFGAGQQFKGIYDFADAHDYRVVGGTSPSVGIAGGWMAGGGHSMLSNELGKGEFVNTAYICIRKHRQRSLGRYQLGLGVDNVQQIKAVLPNGTYITANRCQNQDMFFALRGGGGGTFGVVIEMSTLVHPKKPMQFARVSIDSVNQDAVADFLSIVVANADKWASEGWGGYIIPAAVGSGASSFAMGTTMLNLAEAQASMKPLIDLAKRPAGPGEALTLGNASVVTADYKDILQGIMAREHALILPGSAWAFSSRIAPRESFLGEDNQQKLSSILHGMLTTGQEQNAASQSVAALMMYAVTPHLYSRTMPESDLPGGPGAVSVTPAWRDGLWHVIFARQYAGTTTDPSVVRKIWQATHGIMNPLREFTPGAGAYQNEADPFEPDPIGSFWGKKNYARLLRIKREVDPTNLLTVHNGVGWDDTDERYSCYPDIKV